MAKEFTLKEVSEHNTKDSIWIVINNVVFDLSKFQHEHPGGEDILLENAGKDATDEFIDVGHSLDAKEMLKKYKIGELIKADRKK